MAYEQLNPKVLGQLLIMQSLISNLPDKKSIFSFVCRGLIDIPGVQAINYLENIPDNISTNPYQLNYPVLLGDSYFGCLVFTLSDIKEFKPYESYLQNFIFMIGVVLEERNQRQINEQHKLLLEKRILERTQELTIEKDNLIESQRRFSDLMKNVKLLSVMINSNGDILFCNSFLLSLTGYSQDEVLGKNWFDLFIDKNKVEKLKSVFTGIINGDEFTYNYENEIITKTGEKLLISWNNTILRDADQNIIGTASLGENITERKKAELQLLEKTEEIAAQNEEYLQINEELNQINKELLLTKEKAEESDRLKTAFLQNMSHEIRTPMNAIMGFSDLLIINLDNKDKLKKFSQIIGQRCSDLLEIINDILDISKIESGQLSVNIDTFNLSELFSELQAFFKEYQKRIGKEHIFFNLKDSSSFAGKLIITDKIKLKQIFINLITNAFKYTDNGIIEGGCKLDENNKIVFFVSDTGIGIPRNKHEAVFERFTQLNDQSRKNSGGTGLGLSIVKGLIELLGGQIHLESEPNKGSTFIFSIPVKETTSASHLSSGLEKSDIEILINKTILVVEDDYFNAEYIKEILVDKGINVLQAENGKQAVEKSINLPVDLVLMDIRLPDISGYEAISQIRQHKPNLLIIAQTAYAAQEEKQKAHEIGCVDYISKPLKKELLLSVICKHLVKE